MLKSFLATAAFVASSSLAIAQNKNDLTLKQIDSLGHELVRQKQDYDVARLTCHDKAERDSIEKALQGTEDFLRSKNITTYTTRSGFAVGNIAHPENYLEVGLLVPGYKPRQYRLHDNSPLIKRHAPAAPKTSGARLTPEQIDSAGNALAGHHYEAHKTDFTPYHDTMDKDSILREITLAKDFLARHQVTMPYQASLELPDDKAKEQGFVDRVELELELPDGHKKIYSHDCHLPDNQRVSYQGWFWNF